MPDVQPAGSEAAELPDKAFGRYLQRSIASIPTLGTTRSHEPHGKITNL
jgi:hypothetical protein